MTTTITTTIEVVAPKAKKVEDRKLVTPLTKDVGAFKDTECRGLYLINEADGRRFFRFRYTVNGRDRKAEWPLSVGLAAARDRANKWRDMASEGIEPRRAGQKADHHKISFKAFADEHKADFCIGMNDRELYRWDLALSQVSSLHTVPVAQLTPADIITALTPIFRELPKKAKLIRGRLETLLNVAVSMGLLSFNPATWSLCKAKCKPFTKRLKSAKRPSLPFEQLPALMIKLMSVTGTVARAAEFTVLVGLRSSEVRLAQWTQFKLDGKNPHWVLPREQMKCKDRVDAYGEPLQHVVALSPQAVALLRSLPNFGKGRWVFPTEQTTKAPQPVTQAALNLCFQRHAPEGADVCTHGFRATFRTWVAKARPSLRDRVLAEEAMDHVTLGKIEGAYVRTCAFEAAEDRRELLTAWADYAMPQNVVVLQRHRAA